MKFQIKSFFPLTSFFINSCNNYKEKLFARKKFFVYKKCKLCKRNIFFKEGYQGYNGVYMSYFCTDCIKSEKEAKNAAKIKTKRPNPPGVAQREL